MQRAIFFSQDYLKVKVVLSRPVYNVLLDYFYKLSLSNFNPAICSATPKPRKNVTGLKNKFKASLDQQKTT
jgi:hypothetical protein